MPFVSSGLTAHYSASSGVWQDTARTVACTADGDPIKGLTDQSGSGNHASQSVTAQQGTYRLGRLRTATTPSIQLGAAAAIDIPTTALGAGITAYTIQIACRRRWGGHAGAGGDGYVITGSHTGSFSGGATWFAIGDPNNSPYQWSHGVDRLGVNNTANDGTGEQSPHVFTYRFTGSTQVRLGVDGVYTDVTATIPATLDIDFAITLGALKNGSNVYSIFWEGQIYEVLIYNRALTDGEVTTNETILNNSYGPIIDTEEQMMQERVMVALPVM